MDLLSPLSFALPENPVALWIHQTFGEHSLLAEALVVIVGMSGLVAFASLSAMILVWMERKVSGRFQRRLGPMRTGPHGILQTVADGIKLVVKEWFKPNTADSFTFFLAPFIPMTVSFLILAVLPFSQTMQVADPQLGIVYIAAVQGLGVLAVLLGAWGSNNKYSLLGGLRAGAQALSYEISLLICLLVIVLASGETQLSAIINGQMVDVLQYKADGSAKLDDFGNHTTAAEPWFWGWWIFQLPVAGFIAFIIFLITSTAELNRTPFDTSEAESELTGGYHTEYSGITFSMFFLSEYVNLFTAAALASVLFLGGHLAPIPGLDFIPGFIWLMLKSYALIFVFMWLRWTFPRLRIDQLLNFEWKFLLPASLANLLLAGTVVAIKGSIERYEPEETAVIDEADPAEPAVVVVDEEADDD